MPGNMKYVCFSEKGPRMRNEDSCKIVETGRQTLFVVCDGMGGHSCGEVASKTVCDSFAAYWENNQDTADSLQKIEDAAKMASLALDEASGYYKMGTTLVMASVEGQTAHIAHAGDSRCYVIDMMGSVKYRTIDHIESSSICLPFINRAFFTRHPEEAVPEVKIIELQPHDRLLLCTDGLYNAIGEESLLHILQHANEVGTAAEEFRAICQEKAGDNYTAIIVEME